MSTHVSAGIYPISGREEGQLWYPRKVAVMMKTGKFVVCDRGNERSRMQIFNRNGHFLKKIAIRYIDIVAGLAITPEGALSLSSALLYCYRSFICSIIVSHVSPSGIPL